MSLKCAYLMVRKSKCHLSWHELFSVLGVTLCGWVTVCRKKGLRFLVLYSFVYTDVCVHVHLHSCMCVQTCTYMQGCVHACECKGCLPSLSLFETSSLCCIVVASWPEGVHRFSCLGLFSPMGTLDWQTPAPVPGFRDLNSGSHACMTNAWPSLWLFWSSLPCA